MAALRALRNRAVHSKPGSPSVRWGPTVKTLGIRRPACVRSDRRLSEVPCAPISLFSIRKKVQTGALPSRYPSGLLSLDEDDDGQDFVDALGEAGMPAPKSRTTYEVLRVDSTGTCRKINIKRRDLQRQYGLVPRDMRRVDPALDRAHSRDSIAIKDSALLLKLGGVRCIVAADKCLLFEPSTPPAKKFLDQVVPRLRAASGMHYLEDLGGERHTEVNGNSSRDVDSAQAFELDALESALIVAVGTLDAELVALMKKARICLNSLPAQINPIKLEELRRTKQSSVELESKAQSLVELLEEILDDDDELAEMNLSRQPLREARQRRRERNRLKREHLSSGSTANFQDAQEALEQLVDAENEEEDIEKVEDLMEYYLQRVSATQNMAERILAGARDLEESIGVSLSARRFEVNRLELLLSMGSFASCLGAMIAGIFGMNMRNTMELSVWGFYGVTGGIILLCVYVFFTLLKYTQGRKIV